MSAAPSSRRRIWRGLAGFLVVAAIGAGLWFMKQRRGGEGPVPPAEAATTAAAADSTRPDSTAQAGKAAKKGRFAFGKGKKDEKKKTDPVPVEIASTSRTDVPSYFTGTATIEPEQQADVLAKVAGTILRIVVEEGQDVAAGQVLLEFDDVEYRARHEEMRVRAASQAREYERVASLHAKGLASDREHEDSKLVMETAQAQLHVSEITLGYTSVRAPFAGRVTRRLVNAGQNVTVGTHLYSLADLDPMLARVYMPEKQLERVHLGQDVRLVPEARPDAAYAGRVTLIAPMVDARSGTVKVTVALAGRPEELRPGAFVRAQIKTDIHPQALVVPKRALVAEGGETFVYRAVADSVVKTRVETGFADDSAAEIVVGLRDGDRVVTVGQGGIRSGTKVRELKSAGADTASAVARR